MYNIEFDTVVDVLFLFLLLPIGYIVAFKFNLNLVLTLLLLRFETPIKTVFLLWILNDDK